MLLFSRTGLRRKAMLTFIYQRGFLSKRNSVSTSSENQFKMVSLKLIPSGELGSSILHKKEHGSEKSATDVMNFGIKCAKFCSLASSTLGMTMIPVLTTYLSEGALERPSIMLFTLFANASLGVLALTPLLLHSLTRRFVLDVYYNAKTEVFTTIHYNFLLQKQALRFQTADVVLPEQSAAARRMWIPLATCFVDKHPLLLLLDEVQYSNKLAFYKLTVNLMSSMEEERK